ncbi:2-oxoglutarate (2OG) and Fe(II)-dependent oxygenase superfamily protein [Melia azedarach]|uniref:2-oxoglutarate (2OG) and Fe(II)-dependent oxygenase superfamily protein n=1 Tax=Melia azedarach TaxID=155640 RepID=A0ACC1XCT7_MELAZ|nr:2-oxoglutarate (2OG) and Fe(II)-dependent oxygenase superfamily protein [Melia azedarach]
MAETSFPAKTETISKTVQDLIISGQELPQNYIYKGSDAATLGASQPLGQIPIIDIGLLTSPSSSREELDKLRSALSFWGCFQAINHGMELAFLDQVREVTKQFFALSPEKKQKYSRESGSIEGYGNDMIISEDQTLDWTDRLYLGISPEDQRQLKLWPDDPSSFRETLHEYTAKLEVITQVLLKAMAMSLNLEENCFLDMYGEQSTLFARFNFYPPCPRPDQVIGVKPHADGSAFTILLQDKEVEGLQFQKENQWYRVPIIPEALVINVGDQAEIMCNGIFKSPVHRVVTNLEKERISLAVFCIPNSYKEIEPVNGVVNEARPRLYRTVKDYASIYFEYYQRGRRPIEAAII